MAAGGEFLLGVDGGGTRCRARLACRLPGGGLGASLGEGEAGPANLRLGFLEAFAAVLDAARQCLAAAGLPKTALGRTAACLALAGAGDPTEPVAAHQLPFAHTIVTTDAEAACIGAHGGDDGAIIVIGTGSVGYGIARGRRHRVGGWGLAVSDEGSGAWFGREAVRRALWAHDGRLAWTPVLQRIFDDFGREPHAIVRWSATAKPRDYGRFAPLVIDAARAGDRTGLELVRLGAAHIDALADRLVAEETGPIALVGGLAAAIEPYLAVETRRHLVPPREDALSGALRIAAGASLLRAAAE